MRERLTLDTRYVANQSTLLDLRILLRTVIVVAHGQGRVLMAELLEVARPAAPARRPVGRRRQLPLPRRRARLRREHRAHPRRPRRRGDRGRQRLDRRHARGPRRPGAAGDDGGDGHQRRVLAGQQRRHHPVAGSPRARAEPRHPGRAGGARPSWWRSSTPTPQAGVAAPRLVNPDLHRPAHRPLVPDPGRRAVRPPVAAHPLVPGQPLVAPLPVRPRPRGRRAVPRSTGCRARP